MLPALSPLNVLTSNMKKNCSLACLLFLIVSAEAQPAPTAYLAFLNAVGLPSKTDVRIDGNSLKPAGFPEGNYIESFGLPTGSHQFSFINADCTPVTQPIVVGPAPAPLYVLYNVPVQQPDGKKKQVLKLFTVPGQPPAQSQRRFFALYASDRPSTRVTINQASVSLASGKVFTLTASSLDVTTDPKQPMHYNPSRPGNYIIVFFDGSDARLHQALLQME